LIESGVQAVAKLHKLAVELLVLKDGELDAACFRKLSGGAAFDPRCRASDFHSSLREKRDSGVLHAVELLDQLDDRVEVVAFRLDETHASQTKQNDSDD
jgi:hypothetical protein